MTKNISNRDWETISAYLDGQLSGRKLIRFETRLSQDSELRIALDELHHTRQVLRNTPSLRIPRNFLLTPQMVGNPRHLPRLAPVFGWTSAVASLLLVLLLVGDFFTPAGVIPIAWNNVPRQAAQSSQEIGGDRANAEAPMMDAPALGGSSENNGFDVMAEEDFQEVVVIPEMESVATAAAATEEMDEATATAQSSPEEEPTAQIGEEDLMMAAESPSEPEAASPKVLTDTTLLKEEFASESLEPSQTITGEVTLNQEFVQAEPTATEMATEVVQQAEETPTIPVIETFTGEEPLPPEEKSKVGEQTSIDSPNPADEMAVRAAPEMDTETIVVEEQVSDKIPETRKSPHDFLAGIEAGVILLALSTAIAWLYLRRRGG